MIARYTVQPITGAVHLTSDETRTFCGLRTTPAWETGRLITTTGHDADCKRCRENTLIQLPRF